MDCSLVEITTPFSLGHLRTHTRMEFGAVCHRRDLSEKSESSTPAMPPLGRARAAESGRPVGSAPAGRPDDGSAPANGLNPRPIMRAISEATVARTFWKSCSAWALATVSALLRARFVASKMSSCCRTLGSRGNSSVHSIDCMRLLHVMVTWSRSHVSACLPTSTMTTTTNLDDAVASLADDHRVGELRRQCLHMLAKRIRHWVASSSPHHTPHARQQGPHHPRHRRRWPGKTETAWYSTSMRRAAVAVAAGLACLAAAQQSYTRHQKVPVLASKVRVVGWRLRAKAARV